MGLFLIIIYFQGALIFEAPIYNIVDKNWEKGLTFIPWQFFKNYLTLLIKIWFFKQNFKNDFGPIILFSPIVILSIIIKWHVSLRY
jgi:hypothetical protein